MSYNLFLDDRRSPGEVASYAHPKYAGEYTNNEWVVVKSYEEFVKAINQRGMPDIVSFDHDLADEHYAFAGTNYNDFKEKTGYHCMQFMIDRLLEKWTDRLPMVLIHSHNPVGAENIESLWTSFQKHRNGNYY